MKLIAVLISCVFLISSCRKEGLSKDTGNLEISFHYMDNSFRYYFIYDKEQYYKWYVGESAIPYRQGGPGRDKIVETSIPKGDYGIVILIDNVYRTSKLQYIAANKVTKINMP
jgi:hypothetical protein